jgi:hypothetical protein
VAAVTAGAAGGGGVLGRVQAAAVQPGCGRVRVEALPAPLGESSTRLPAALVQGFAHGKTCADASWCCKTSQRHAQASVDSCGMPSSLQTAVTWSTRQGGQHSTVSWTTLWFCCLGDSHILFHLLHIHCCTQNVWVCRWQCRQHSAVACPHTLPPATPAHHTGLPTAAVCGTQPGKHTQVPIAICVAQQRHQLK